MIDLVFPNNNEKELIEMAEYLGYSGLCLAYNEPKNIDELKKTTKIRLLYGLLTKPMVRAKADLVLVKNSDQNRAVMEKMKPDILFGLESDNRRDYMHHRASGLNQVLCKIAAQNNITIGFSISAILSSTPMKKSILLGRISQNIRLCRKYKVKIIMASFAKTPYEMRAPNDIKSLLLVLDADTKQAALNSTI